MRCLRERLRAGTPWRALRRHRRRCLRRVNEGPRKERRDGRGELLHRGAPRAVGEVRGETGGEKARAGAAPTHENSRCCSMKSPPKSLKPKDTKVSQANDAKHYYLRDLSITPAPFTPPSLPPITCHHHPAPRPHQLPSIN